MKRILFLIAIIACACNVMAQSASPRFGTTANQDNTFRTLTNTYLAVADATGADSVLLKPSAFNCIVRVTCTDSLFFKSPVTTRCYAGDRLTIVASGSSGNKLKLAGTNFISAGTATLSSSGRAVLSFIFDGAKWVESGRVVQ